MSNLSFVNNDKSIDDFFADFLEYRKNRQDKAVPTLASQNSKKLIDISQVKNNVMPPPLELTDKLENVKIDRYTVKMLYNRLSEQLLPYIEKAIKEWDYEGSPIYDIEVSRDAIGTITDKVIYDAKDDIPEVNQILLSEKFGNWSENEMLRSIVEAMIINEIFIEQRVKNPFKENQNETDTNDSQVKDDGSKVNYDLEDFI